MSYLDRKEAIEDLQREGLPPASDELINQVFESYYCSKIKRQADEIMALKIQLLQLRRQLGEPDFVPGNTMPVRSYCGEEMEHCWDEETFLALGKAMADEAGYNEVAEVEELKPELVQEESAIDKYNAAREFQNLAVFLKFHYDCDQCKKLEPGCQELRRTYCGQHEEECVEWLMGDESTNWLMELFQRPPVPTPQFAKAEPEPEAEPVAEPELPCKTVSFAESLRNYEKTLRKEIEAEVHPACASDCYDYEAQQYCEDYEEPVCDDEEG
jgi:hypothetical protein